MPTILHHVLSLLTALTLIINYTANTQCGATNPTTTTLSDGGGSISNATDGDLDERGTEDPTTKSSCVLPHYYNSKIRLHALWYFDCRVNIIITQNTRLCSSWQWWSSSFEEVRSESEVAPVND